MATRRLSGIATSSSVPDNGGDHSGGGGSAGGYVDDVFSTYLYTGQRAADGNSEPQTIVNGVDLNGEGGLVWIKGRTVATVGPPVTQKNYLFDTERGPNKSISSDESSKEGNPSNSLTSFNSDGFDIGRSTATSTQTVDFASWTFRKAPKFFDVVTYVGDGAQNRGVPHGLGCTPGMILIKSTDQNRGWSVWHNSFPTWTGSTIEGDVSGSNAIGQLVLNTNAAYVDGGYFTYMNDEAFGLNRNSMDNNVSGEEYVAYLFAHDDSDESMIKCGVLDVSNYKIEEDLGWEPQWVLTKSTDSSGDWNIVDNMRGSANPQPLLYPNLTSAEVLSEPVVEFTSRGFKQHLFGGSEGIFMAIRRPNKPAEEFEPEELFGIVNQIPANSANNNTVIPTSNQVDAIIGNPDYDGGKSEYMSSRLQGGNSIRTDTSGAELNGPQFYFDYTKGFRQTIANGETFLGYTITRQPGFFDVVCYEGDGQAGREVPHNLGVVPEMMWVRGRDAANWAVYVSEVGATKSLWLDLPNEAQDEPAVWNSTSPSDTSFTLGTYSSVNRSGSPSIAYLFASVPGISKVGNYTGTAAELDVNCGFTTGARFVLIKRTDSTGDWYFWDTERGITSGNDPYLLLNASAGEVTDTDYIDPLSSGFKVTANANAAINASDGEYIFYAIA